MRAVIKVCEHCGCEYSYYVSGYPCTSSTNDEHLCPRCKHAVNEALKAIPVEFEKVWKERPDDFTKEQVADIIDTAEAWEAQNAREAEASGWPRMKRIIYHDYETYIEFYNDGKRYEIFYNSKEEYIVLAHSYAKVNHDAKKYEFARYVKYDDHQGFEMVCYTKCSHLPKIEMIPVKPMPAPVGNLCYMDYIFDGQAQKSKQPNFKKKKRKK